MDIKQKLDAAIVANEVKYTSFYQNLENGWGKAPSRLLPIKQAMQIIFEVVKNNLGSEINTPDHMLTMSLNSYHYLRVDYDVEGDRFSIEFRFNGQPEPHETKKSTDNADQAIDWIVDWAGMIIGIDRAYKKLNT